jgi:hypothetical protein
MNSPWKQWSPYWWQTVTAVSPFGMSFGLLINGKRCQDCFNMCLLDGTWPDWYCPLRPF